MYELEEFHRNISEEALFQNLAEVWRTLGRQPKFRDCRKPISKFSAHTYAARYGNWRTALGAFAAWAEVKALAERS